MRKWRNDGPFGGESEVSDEENAARSPTQHTKHHKRDQRRIKDGEDQRGGEVYSVGSASHRRWKIDH
jgi:hypothetical protein